MGMGMGGGIGTPVHMNEQRTNARTHELSSSLRLSDLTGWIGNDPISYLWLTVLASIYVRLSLLPLRLIVLFECRWMERKLKRKLAKEEKGRSLGTLSTYRCFA